MRFPHHSIIRAHTHTHTHTHTQTHTHTHAKTATTHTQPTSHLDNTKTFPRNARPNHRVVRSVPNSTLTLRQILVIFRERILRFCPRFPLPSKQPMYHKRYRIRHCSVFRGLRAHVTLFGPCTCRRPSPRLRSTTRITTVSPVRCTGACNIQARPAGPRVPLRLVT